MATSAPTQPAPITWISDTGATDHFTPDLNTIPDNHSYTDSQLVSVGNGQQLPISNIGNGQLRTSSSLFHLRKVLHIPSMRYNLLSVNRFCQDNACSFHFDARRFQITDLLTAKPLYTGFSKDGLYPIHGLSLPSWNSRISALLSRSASSSPSSHNSKACLSTVCSNVSSAALWHMRLGHPQPCILQQLSSHNLLGPRPISSNSSFCKHCVMGKMTQLPFSPSHSCTKSPLELVHSDV